MNKVLVESADSYRIPMMVQEYRGYSELNCFPVCPRCKSSLEVDFQAYCDRCGQALNWKKYHKAKPSKDSMSKRFTDISKIRK